MPSATTSTAATSPAHSAYLISPRWRRRSRHVGAGSKPGTVGSGAGRNRGIRILQNGGPGAQSMQCPAQGRSARGFNMFSYSPGSPAAGRPMNGQTPRHLLAQAASDTDPLETKEWLDALRATVAESGSERGLYLLELLEEQAQQLGIVPHVQPYSAYRNTI